jgi:hypothetical protein
MILALLTFLTALLMEGIGSYMSVVGWNSILLGDFVIIALFIVLDLAKIISVSFVYQTWNVINKTLRSYFVFAVVFLMLLTSAGSFGYLSSSFQTAVQPNKQNIIQLEASKTEREQLMQEKKQLTDSKIKIENQIAKLPDENVAGRTRLIANFKEETRNINTKVNKIDSRLEQLNKTVVETSTKQIEKDAHIGPIVYIANTFNIPLETVVTYAILSIIFVFDPLAIALILAGNFLIASRKKKPVLEIDNTDTIKKVLQPLKKPVKLKKESTHKDKKTSIIQKIRSKRQPKIVEPKIQEPEIKPEVTDLKKIEPIKAVVKKIRKTPEKKIP